MAKVKRTLFRLPYIGILLVVLVLVLILVFEKKVTPYVTDNNLNLQTPVLQTNIVSFEPEVSGEVRDGTCYTNSIVTPAESAWRCTVGNQIYDPCVLAKDGETLVCGADPSKETSGFSLDLQNDLPEPRIPEDAVNNPWILELASGRICTLADGATRTIGEERVNYMCESSNENRDVVIVGDLKKGKLWNAKRVVLANNEPTLTIIQEGIVPLKTVWIVE